MKDIQDKIGDILYERLSSPFAHSFIIAWIFFNRGLLLYLFSSGGIDYEIRISKIDSLLNWPNGIMYPFLGALGSLIFYVASSWLFHYVWEVFIVQKQNTRSRIQKIKLITSDDELRLRKLIKGLQDEIYESQEKFNERMESKDLDMSKLIESHSLEIELSNQTKAELEQKNKTLVEERAKEKEADYAELEKLKEELEASHQKAGSLKKELSNKRLDIEVLNKRLEIEKKEIQQIQAKNSFLQNEELEGFVQFVIHEIAVDRKKFTQILAGINGQDSDNIDVDIRRRLESLGLLTFDAWRLPQLSGFGTHVYNYLSD